MNAINGDDGFGFPVPDTLLAVLEHDGARARFESLTPSQRRAVVENARGLFPDEMRVYFERLLLN